MSDTIQGPCSGECGKTIIRQRTCTRFDYLPFWCDACIERDNAEREHQHAMREYEHRVRRSGLPKQHHRDLDGLDHHRELIGACHAWAAERVLGLLLTGPVGVGKTTLAGAAAFKMLERRGLLWVPVSLLFARLSTGFESDPHRWALEALSGDRPIVLDDLDKARPSEYAAEQVFVAIDQRVQHEIPLLVTTNLKVSELAERWPEPWGEAIGSRLVGYCRRLEVAGPDRRLSNARTQAAA